MVEIETVSEIPTCLLRFNQMSMSKYILMQTGIGEWESKPQGWPLKWVPTVGALVDQWIKVASKVDVNLGSIPVVLIPMGKRSFGAVCAMHFMDFVGALARWMGEVDSDVASDVLQ